MNKKTVKRARKVCCRLRSMKALLAALVGTIDFSAEQGEQWAFHVIGMAEAALRDIKEARRHARRIRKAVACAPVQQGAGA